MNFAVRPIMVLCIFLACRVSAQENIRQYVQHNTTPVATIDPDSSDYRDLTVLGDAIGQSRIVMLGEQDHGDAPTFLAKTRLIKYLHEKKGFNVLAFESDFFALNEGGKKDSGERVDSFLRHSIYPLWTYCDACRNLFFQYLPAEARSSSPLEVAGFDCQMGLAASRALDSLIKTLRLPITTAGNYEKEIAPVLLRWGRNVKDSSLNKKYLGYLAEIKQQLIEKLPAGNFWLQLIDNLEAEDREYGSSLINHVGSNIRDRQMAVNLKWLAEMKYPNEKIIVWAHSYHVSKFAGHYSADRFNSGITMGTVLTSDSRMMESTYIVGFSSYEGTAGRLFVGHPYKVNKPKRDGFENWIDRSYDYAFVDFRKFNQQFPGETGNFYMAGGTTDGYYHKDAIAPWNKIFDGVFFIRKMYPCKKIE